MNSEQLERLRWIAEAALGRKARDVVALDVAELTSFADGFVIASGDSDRQVRAIAEAILEAAREHDVRPLGVEGLKEGRWVLLDLNDVVAHVFLHEDRERYDLERLWGDAAVLEFGDDEPGAGRRSAR